jgi:hypothetical protein
MNTHPFHTGEHLAHDCLTMADGDYSRAADLILAQPDTMRRDHAMKALALWAAFWPLANNSRSRISRYVEY